MQRGLAEQSGPSVVLLKTAMRMLNQWLVLLS